MAGFQSFSFGIYDEIKNGTFEQLNLCPFGIDKIFIIRVILQMLFNLILVSIILYILMIITKRKLNIPFLKTISLIFLTLPSIWGFGLFFGGLTLIHKKINTLLQLLNFFLIFLVSVNAYPINLFSFLPFSTGASIIRNIIIKNIDINIFWYFFIFINSLFYLICGILFYKLFEKKAKRDNLLGQY